MQSIIYMDRKKRAAGGVRFLRAENRMQVIDSTCDHPSGSCRKMEKPSKLVADVLSIGWRRTGAHLDTVG